MSAIYLGRHIDSPPEAPNVVALKIARHDTSMDDRLVKMFLEEGRLIQRLVHPNIVRTLEVGADADQDYIAMELMMGKTFAAVHDTLAARQVRMSPEIAAWTAARVADALDFAHQLADENGRPLNLVHRDVNPANIFATFRGEVKLFDFGLAKVTTGDSMSSQHMLAGKLSYLSPEQVMQIPVDRRSDIFSLGTSLWEFLTAKRLFRRDSDIDTVRAVQLGPIPDVRTVAPELPEDLARIVKTALERNRDHRYPTAGYLARELDNWLYQRTSPQEVTARLAQLVDTIFPGESKRQGGWLKPAITSSAQKPNFNVTMPSAGNAKPERPAGLEVRRDSRETTAVMVAAPTFTPAEGVPVLQPGPLTPREGIPAVPPSSQIPSLPASAAVSMAPSVAPTTPRMGSATGGPPVMTARRATTRMPAAGDVPRKDTPAPISRTDVGLPAAGVRSPFTPSALMSEPPPPDVGETTDITAAPPIPPPEGSSPSPISRRSPVSGEHDLDRTIMTASPSFPPPPKAPSITPSSSPVPPPQKRASLPPPSPSAPPKMPSMPPASMRPVGSPSIAPKATPSMPPSAPAKGSPSMIPRATPASPMQPVGPITARPSRAPIPLPSSKKSIIPLPSKTAQKPAPAPAPAPAPKPTPQPTPAKKSDTNPPDSSKTQIDVPAPERKS